MTPHVQSDHESDKVFYRYCEQSSKLLTGRASSHTASELHSAIRPQPGLWCPMLAIMTVVAASFVAYVKPVF